MANYESDITRFLREMKAKDPQLEEKQRQGRALLWEKEPIDLEALKRTKMSKVAQQAYVYQTQG